MWRNCKYKIEGQIKKKKREEEIQEAEFQPTKAISLTLHELKAWAIND
jgi:hypothetical protein